MNTPMATMAMTVHLPARSDESSTEKDVFCDKSCGGVSGEDPFGSIVFLSLQFASTL
jgi:hypothetical protein